MYKLAPVILFVYNRPKHTKMCIQSLEDNLLAELTELYIVCDGPKNEFDKLKTDEVKNIVSKKYRFKSITILSSNSNRGLAKSVTESVTNIISKHGKVIVAEDDLILSKGFLKYMNDALTIYENDSRVMHISGYLFPLKKTCSNTSFFIKSTSTWGWATWKRAWEKLIVDEKILLEKISANKNNIDTFNFNSNYSYLNMLKKSAEKKVDSWGIKWYASVYINNGLGLFPNKSLVQNIGHDGTGTHSKTGNFYFHKNVANSINIDKITIDENREMRKQFELFYNKISKQSLYSRIKNKIYKLKKGGQ